MLQNHPEHKVLHHFPKITNPAACAGQASHFFGGDQGWYNRYTCRQSGCGPVAAANLVAFYAQASPEPRSSLPGQNADGLSRQDYLQFMEQSYNAMGTFELPGINHWNDKRQETIRQLLADPSPGAKAKAEQLKKHFLNKLPPSFGNSTGSFIKGTLRFAASLQIRLRPYVLKTWHAGKQQGLDFIRTGLAQGSPVVLLTRFNTHKIQLFPCGSAAPCRESRIKTPHFMTIIDMQEREPGVYSLVVSTWGMLAVIDYGDLCQSWQKLGALRSSLIYFEEIPSDRGI